ncbi:MAG: potassium channel family protein, partial [Acidimicrobiales bacterium]
VLVRTLGGVVALVLVVTWQLHAVRRSDVPQLRAVEGFALTIPLTVVCFAAVYLSLSAQSPHAFSEPLDHVGALYLAMATITTIGFGDIAARSDAARVAVMLQMVADIAVLAVGTRVAVVTVRATLAERG